MRTTDGQIEVLSGLTPGESLVVRGAEALMNGSPVRVVRPGEAPAGRDAAPDKGEGRPADKSRPGAKREPGAKRGPGSEPRSTR
jgi:hypothetical protein